ncbi:MAG: tRNA lysidine(34) synthetase TilS [Fimbriimonadales bacterium]|nr:tRNA lysidine(34) synthetase TilS [Fimbriimonadales bacterium]
MEILLRTRATITERHLLPPEGGVVIVGYSGGADSTALLHLLVRLQDELRLCVHAAHLHHGMRPEADADVEACRRVCQQLGVPLHVERVDVPALARAHKLSLEEAGRNARYAFFERLAQQLNAVAVALAHTRDDQIETILINLLRGTGPRGLCGMPYKRGRIIRPLLDVSREQTHRYCAEQQLPTVFDSTNLDPHQLRRRVRAELIPLLRALSPAFDRHLLRLAAILEQEETYWDEQVGSALASVALSTNALSRSGFAALPPALQRRVLREWLRPYLGTLRLPPFEILEGVRCAALTDAPTSWQLSPNLRLTTDEAALTLHHDTPEPEPYEYPVPLNSPVLIPEAGAWLEVRSTGGTPVPCLDAGAQATMARTGLSVPQLGADAQATMARTGLSVPQLDAGAQATMARTGLSVLQLGVDAQATSVYLDADAVQGQLTVRNARRGDRFQPLGMSAPKKLSDIFIDRKVPKTERKRLPLLCDAAGILWIPGYTIAERARITPRTQRALQATLYRNASGE